ncbi:hypothetical protein LTR17_026600 [Elasticomyces elasticus]|nr:hypothetical protein LTR17_026600 [Elasticomyces elasticus]
MAADQHSAAIINNARRSRLRSDIEADRFEDVFWMVSTGVGDSVIRLLQECQTEEQRRQLESESQIAHAYLLDPTSNPSSTLTTSSGGSSIPSSAASYTTAASDAFQYSGSATGGDQNDDCSVHWSHLPSLKPVVRQLSPILESSSEQKVDLDQENRPETASLAQENRAKSNTGVRCV